MHWMNDRKDMWKRKLYLKYYVFNFGRDNIFAFRIVWDEYDDVSKD